VGADRGAPGPGPTAVVPVPEVRDYHQINRRVTQLLDAGHAHIRLAGVEGQRLLLWNLRGDWDALIVVEGRAGPELAAELDAPRLRVVCTGAAADGAGRGLRAGRLLLAGACGTGLGYAQRGGVIATLGAAGPRAGLEQLGGLLILAGPVGPLAGERQAGGTLVVLNETVGPHFGRAQRGGWRERWTGTVAPPADEPARIARAELAGLVASARRHGVSIAFDDAALLRTGPLHA
jgi:glutamate synthase domain-containing protein 3